MQKPLDEPKTRRTILLTGAAGFLGTLLRHHFNQQKDVHLISLPGRKDLARLSRLDTKKIDTILHAGFEVSFSPSSPGVSDNVKSTRRLLKFASQNGLPHFIFLGAAGVLGVSSGNTTRNESSLGRTDTEFEDYLNTQYIQDKIQCDKLVRGYEGTSSILYLTTVYGPGMSEGTLKPLRKLRSLKPFAVCPPGGTSFLDWRDFIDAVEVVLEKKTPGAFTITSGNTDYCALFQNAAQIQGIYRKRIVPLSKGLLRKALHFGDRLGMGTKRAVIASSLGYKYYSPLRSQKELGWRAQYKLKDALESALLSPPL